MKKYSLLAISTILLVMSICIPSAKAVDGVSMPTVTSNLDYNHLITLLKDDPAQTNALVLEKGVIDLLTGNYVKEFPSGYDDIAVNDEASYYALMYWSKLVIYNQFGELIREISKLDEEYIDSYEYKLEGFIPNTNILLISSHKQLVGYDVENQKVMFTRTLNDHEQIHTTAEYIAISSGNTINLYNPSGVYLDTLELDSDIMDFVFSPDGQQLIVSTNDPQLTVLEANHNFERKTLTASQFRPGQIPLDQIEVDYKGKYLIGTSEQEGFRIFNYITGERIHTSIDGIEPGYSWNGDIAITPNGKYILVNNTLYNGKNLAKYVTSITVPVKYQTIELGSKIQPMVTVTRADGSHENITSGVTWRLNNSNAAYINNTTNLLMTKKTGLANLKASYLSFEYVMNVKVVDTKPPKLSGIKDKTIYVGAKFNAKSGVKATDAGEGNLTAKIKVSGSVNTKKAGTYKLKYTVTDSSGNKTSETRKIIVKKTKK